MPDKIGKTKLIKLIYLFEYYRVQRYGKQLTEAKFIRYKHGPFAPEIYDEVEELKNEEIISTYRHLWYNGNISVLHEIQKDEINENLNKEDRLIADLVIEELNGLTLDEVLEKVYSTPPMKTILDKEEKQNTNCTGEVLNMSEKKDVTFNIKKEKLLKARKERKESQNKGTDEEYLKCLIKEHNNLKPLRRRVNYYDRRESFSS